VNIGQRSNVRARVRAVRRFHVATKGSSEGRAPPFIAEGDRPMIRLFTFLAALLAVISAAAQAQTFETDKLPAPKRSRLGLYLSAPQAYELKQREGDKLLFVDVRTRAEVMYLGTPTVTDAVVPAVSPVGGFAVWDEAKETFKTELNEDFVTELEKRLAQKRLTKTDPIVLMCRSGDRSARAINMLLTDRGYTKVYSVVDGYEGDLSSAGRRDVNGWKNAGLPWTYELDKAKVMPAK
jgi:rhodanese-related sulfurtransferase